MTHQQAFAAFVATGYALNAWRCGWPVFPAQVRREVDMAMSLMYGPVMS